VGSITFTDISTLKETHSYRSTQNIMLEVNIICLQKGNGSIKHYDQIVSRPYTFRW